MPKKMAMVDYYKCRPEQCDSGVCAAVSACPRKLLKQETLYQAPMPNPALCQGCAKCVLACPLKAIQLI
ncbi:MAG TPA: 4Fe-4S binding protein [Dehalococcoidia bacterium]